MDLATLAAAAQLQAALVLAVGVVGWVATGLGRRRELIRQEAGRLTAAAARRAADGRTAPPVTVVLPIRGCRPHSRANWSSQLNTSYGGPLRFIFVVDSEADPAVPVVSELLQARRRDRGLPPAPVVHIQPAAAAPAAMEAAAASPQQRASRGRQHHEQQEPPVTPGRYSLRPRRGGGGAAPLPAPAAAAVGGFEDLLVVSGPTSGCSQKIHNLLAGVQAAVGSAPAAAAAGGSSEGYVLFLDDDVALHPGTIGRLVDELEGDDGAFMATGYPFDLVPPGAPLQAYAVLVYHLPLSIAFSTQRRAPFVWGGCMLLRARELAAGGRGALQAWRSGGYSDDMLLAALCNSKGLPVATHRAALLPQLLPARLGWVDYWNYLRRQLYVLDTYHNDECYRLNHTMMAIHSWGSFCVAFALLATLAQLACLAAPAVTNLAAAATQQLAPRLAVAAEALPALAAAGRVLSSVAAAAAAAAAPLARAACAAAAARQQAAWQRGALWVFIGVVAAAQCALGWMGRQSMALMRALSEEGSGGSGKGGGRGSGGKAVKGGGSRGSGGSAAILAQAAPLCWLRVWAGILIESLVLPYCVTYTLATSDIVWAGITYRKRRGRVTVVARG